MLAFAAGGLEAPAPTPIARSPAALESASAEEAGALDGLAFEGRVRARGLIGLFSVRGRLAFDAGALSWTVGASTDTGPYSVREIDGVLEFTAEHVLENDERALWTGRYDGSTVREVTIVWTREDGDFIHDLFLPSRVTLDFRPLDAP